MARIFNGGELCFSKMGKTSPGVEWKELWAVHQARTDMPIAVFRTHPDDHSDREFSNKRRGPNDPKVANPTVERLCTELLKNELCQRDDITSYMGSGDDLSVDKQSSQ
jgi:hypothetical protein